MRILITAVGVAVLAGCVSPSDLKANSPTTKAVTKKSPKEYALCVFPQWQDARSEATMSARESPGERRRMAVFTRSIFFIS